MKKLLFILSFAILIGCSKTNVTPQNNKTAAIDSTIYHVWTLDTITQYNGIRGGITVKSFPNSSWDIQATQVCITIPRGTICNVATSSASLLTVYYAAITSNYNIEKVTPTYMLLAEYNFRQRVTYQYHR